MTLVHILPAATMNMPVHDLRYEPTMPAHVRSLASYTVELFALATANVLTTSYLSESATLPLAIDCTHLNVEPRSQLMPCVRLVHHGQ